MMKRRIKAVAALAVLVLALSILGGCGAKKATTGTANQTQAESKPAGQSSSGVLVVLANSGFSDVEYSVTRKALEGAGYKVTVANSSGSASMGMDGTSVKPDIVIADAKSSDYAGLVIIGGDGAREYYEYTPLQELARQLSGQGKTVAAICIAPVVLANAGVLQGKKGTVFPPEKDMLIAGGCQYTGNPVDVDGKFVTGNGPPASEPFAQAVVLSLQSN